jgi:hypothetical protein
LDPTKNDLRRCAKEAILRPSEFLVDNTLYGHNLERRRDGQIGGVNNMIISSRMYSKQKKKEKDREENMENLVSDFSRFRKKMIDDTVQHDEQDEQRIYMDGPSLSK